MARPRKEIDFDQFEKLCYLQCTQKEIMGYFSIDSKHTLEARIKEYYGKEHSFCTIYEQKSQGGKIAIRRLQLQNAEKGSTAMLIWLGKQHLKQRDNQSLELTGKDGGPVETIDYSKLSNEELKTIIAIADKAKNG